MKIENGLPIPDPGNQIRKKVDTPPAPAGDTVSLSGQTAAPARIVSIPQEKSPSEQVKAPAEMGRHIANATGGGMTGGASGAALTALSHDQLMEKLQTLEGNGVKFYRQKSSWLPFVSDKKKAISAGEVASTLESGTPEQKQALNVKEEQSAFLPLRSTADVRELEAFKTGLNLTAMPGGELAKLLNDMSGLKYAFKAQGSEGKEKVGTYGAYNILTGDWKENSPFGREVFVESGGVTMAILNEDKASDPQKIREEINDAKTAVADLAKLRKDITSSEIKLVGKPVTGTTFAQRAKLFIDLNNQKFELEDVKNSYRLVANSSKSQSEFEENAKTMLQLHDDFGHSDARQIQWAYNYIQQNLKGNPGLKASFHRLIKATHELNSGIQGLEFIQNPVGKEDMKTRENIFVTLVEKQRDNTEAINDYQTIQANVKPGETFQQAADEFTGLMTGLEKRGKSLVTTRRGFTYLRQNLKDQPGQQESFKDIFRETGDIRETIGAMEFMNNPIGSPDRRVREEVFMKILKNEKHTPCVQDDYSFVAKNLDPGENFSEAGDLFAGLLGDLKDQYDISRGAQEAYTHLHKNYKNDPDARTRFRNLLAKIQNVDGAAHAYSVVVKPVGNESYQDREKAYLQIFEQGRYGDEATKNYEGVAATLRADENIADAATHFATIAKTLTYQDNKTPLDAYRETKDLFKDDPNGLSAFIEIADATKAFTASKDAYELLKKPVRDETFDDRKGILIDIVKDSKIKSKNPNYNDEREAAKEGVESYKTIMTRLDASENLSEAADRFKLLLRVLAGENQNTESCDAFSFIADEMAKGTFKDKTARQVTEDLAQILLITDSLEMAKTQLLHPSNQGTNVIEEEDDFIIIGGVKLPVKKGENKE